MTLVAVLDTGTLGLITHPRGGQEVRDCRAWFDHFLARGGLAVVPAIADYELRRELLRVGSSSISRLDDLIRAIGYLPLDQDDLHHAAELWADARRSGMPTAANLSLDGDCILAAQSKTVYRVLSPEQIVEGFEVVIATSNVRHLSRYARAERWRSISMP
jgi:predicted nucleic acid-binding protein